MSMIEGLFSEKCSCLAISGNTFDVLRFPHADGICVFHLHDLVFNFKSKAHVSISFELPGGNSNGSIYMLWAHQTK